MLSDEQLQAIQDRNDRAEVALLSGFVPRMLRDVIESQADVTVLLQEVKELMKPFTSA